ncbi:MmcQ/YjbR family DNA-binding protein [Lacticaseibacillus kribbianus]|uniref:MmcQ/YjbR family DNA-binding protein n=1 Tax=Lacticaseibacillus kribbianus TaxID=2926292 RepID=UPI001CD1A45F|nr:MmcQ/YjbR family DNA-binding protein [Lacticaseibacillus kribbianus]
MTRDDFIQYCKDHYPAVVDRPFMKFPDYVALRHPDGKWFAVVMNVPAAKMGLLGDGELDIVDLKCDPELNSILQAQPNFRPGYHMNKAHWLTALLPAFKSAEELGELIDGSYEATR